MGALGPKWPPLREAPPISTRSCSAYAARSMPHTDRTDARQVIDAAALLGLDSPSWTEGWRPIKPEAIPKIAALARAMDAHLDEAVKERAAQPAT